MEERYYTPAEVGEHLRVDVSTLYRWIRDEKLVAIKIGRDYRIAESDLQAFLEERKSNRRS